MGLLASPSRSLRAAVKVRQGARMLEMPGVEQNRPKREAPWTAGGRIGKVRLYAPVGAQTMTLCAPDTKSCRVWWFPSVVLVWLWYDLFLPRLHCSPLEWVNIPLYTGSLSFIVLQGLSQESVLNLRRNSGHFRESFWIVWAS